MAIPVLLTVGALGVGWVALSQKRATLPPATLAKPEAGDPVTETTAEDVAAAAESPASVQLADPIVATQTPVTDETIEPSLAMGTSEQNRSLGGSDPSTLPTAPAPAAPVADAISSASPADILFGSGNFSRSQEAFAIMNIGPLTDMVW